MNHLIQCFRELADALGESFDDVAETLVNLDKCNLDLVAEEKPLDRAHITKVLSNCSLIHFYNFYYVKFIFKVFVSRLLWPLTANRVCQPG